MSRFQRLVIEIKQIKSLQQDFSKTKKKCQAICNQLQIQFPKLKQYCDIEREVQLKVNILDHSGLLNLKKRFSEAQLLQTHHQLNYSLQRRNTRNQFTNKNIITNTRLSQNPNSNNTIQSSKTIKTNQKLNVINQKKLPFYVQRNQSAEQKLNQISNFISNLKVNMKLQSENYNQLKLNQFLMFEPHYVTIKEKLELYKMRQQELERIFQVNVKKQAQKYIENLQIIQENQFHKTFKVYTQKSTHDKIQMQSVSKQQQIIHQLSHTDQKILDELQISIKDLNLQDKNDLASIRKKVNEDFEQIKLKIQQNPDNLINVYDQINQNVSAIQDKLKQLRARRKKIFIDDDIIWDEMEKN